MSRNFGRSVFAIAALALCTLTLAAATAPLTVIDAVKDKNISAVRALLKKHADVNLTEGDGATALQWACYRDDAAMVDVLLAAGAKVNVANDLKITPLFLAAANGNAAIVQKLIEADATPDAASASGVTPLMEAARTGSAATVSALIAHEAKVNAHENDRQQTSLMWAAAERHPDVVKILLDHGADVHARTGTRDLIVMLDQGPRGVKTSRENGAKIEGGGSTALIFAAESGDAESARLLLTAGADVNDSAADGNSALVLAAFSDNSPVAAALLEAGADPNAAGAGYSALHVAALRGNLTTVKALLAKGANPNAQMTKGSPVRRFGSQWALPSTLVGATPLFVAAIYEEVDIAHALLDAGASPDLALPSGVTPLMAAAGTPVEKQTRPSDLVRWNVVDSDTPTVPRAETDVHDIANLLLDAGADANHASETGDTALHAAAAGSMLSVIQLLADRGANLDAKNKQGATPLTMTIPRTGRGGQAAAANPEAQARAKAAGDLLKKLGATPGL